MDDLRAEFDGIDLARIRASVQNARRAREHLEYQSLHRKKWKTKDLGRLARVVSGFANSGGGICIWGVEVDDEDETAAPVARKLEPVKRLKEMLSALRQHGEQAAEPRVEGLLHKAVPEPEEPDRGYLVTYVPPSDAGPHMARLGEDRYYRRCGGRFQTIGHGELVALLTGRGRPRPMLYLQTLGITPQEVLLVVIGLYNAGNAALMCPSLDASLSPEDYVFSEYGLDGRKHFGLPCAPEPNASPRHAAFTGGSQHRLEPGSELLVTKIGFCRRLSGECAPPDLHLRYLLAGDDVEAIEGNYTFASKHLIQPGHTAIVDPYEERKLTASPARLEQP